MGNYKFKKFRKTRQAFEALFILQSFPTTSKTSLGEQERGKISRPVRDKVDILMYSNEQFP